MTKIQLPSDCGNSPKKQFLKEYYMALANGDTGFLTRNISDDCPILYVGNASIRGQNEFLQKVQSIPYWQMPELTIDAIITHGSEAAVSGNMVGITGETYMFCDIFRFKSAGSSMISEIKTFLLPMESTSGK